MSIYETVLIGFVVEQTPWECKSKQHTLVAPFTLISKNLTSQSPLPKATIGFKV